MRATFGFHSSSTEPSLRRRPSRRSSCRSRARPAPGRAGRRRRGAGWSARAAPRRPGSTAPVQSSTARRKPASRGSADPDRARAPGGRCRRSPRRGRGRGWRCARGARTGSSPPPARPTARGRGASRRAARTAPRRRPRCRCRRSTGAPSACSGDMYEGVPRSTPTSVSSSPFCPDMRAMPKSMSLGTDLARGGAREEDVLGLDVAVDDVLAVRGDERAHDGHQDVERLLDREPAALLEVAAQADAVEQLLDDVVGGVAPLPDLEHADDVGVLDARGGARLAAEAPHHVGVPGDVGVQHLERHAAADPGVLRLEDGAHRALPDLPDQHELAADHHPGAEGGDARPRLGIDRARLHPASLLPSAPSRGVCPGLAGDGTEKWRLRQTSSRARALGGRTAIALTPRRTARPRANPRHARGIPARGPPSSGSAPRAPRAARAAPAPPLLQCSPALARRSLHRRA